MINYDTRSLAEGDGVVTQVEFDFLVTKKSDVLLSIVESGQDTITFRGDNATYLTDLTFDSVIGGGTATLVTALAVGKTLYIDLDVQEPDQPNMYRIVNNYLQSFRSIERALDYLVTQIQTLSRWKEQSVKFPRHINVANFNPDLPEALVGDTTNVVFVTNDTGDGWKVGPSVVSLAAWAASAVASAAAALASEVAAAASAAAAAVSAAAALVSQNAAAASAVLADTYRQNAASSETNANASAVAAAASESAAGLSQTAADDSATAASDSEIAAALSETNAAASEVAAGLSETNAAASEVAAGLSETAAALSETNAAVSAAAAAVSAGAAAPTVVASKAAPTAVVGANGILFTSVTNDTINYVQGSGGAVVLAHATRNIQAGTIDTQTLKLIGCSDVNTITMGDGAGIDTAGSTYVIKNGTILKMFWDQTNWTVESWNGV